MILIPTICVQFLTNPADSCHCVSPGWSHVPSMGRCADHDDSPNEANASEVWDGTDGSNQHRSQGLQHYVWWKEGDGDSALSSTKGQ